MQSNFALERRSSPAFASLWIASLSLAMATLQMLHFFIRDNPYLRALGIVLAVSRWIAALPRSRLAVTTPGLSQL